MNGVGDEAAQGRGTRVEQGLEVLRVLSDAAERLEREEPLLTFDEISLLDVLLSPLYLALMRVQREDDGGLQRPWLASLRSLGHRFKRQGALLLAQHQLGAEPESYDLTLWPSNGGHVKLLAPIAAGLTAAGSSCTTFLTKPALLHAVRPWPGRVALGRGFALEASAAYARGELAAAKLFRRGLALPEWSHQPTRARAAATLRQVLVEQLAFAHFSLLTAKQVLRRARGRPVVVGNDLTVEGRALALTSRRTNSVSVVPLHGAATANPLSSRHVAHRILAYGEADRLRLLSLGISGGRIFTCGSPTLDALPTQSRLVHPALARELQLARPWVLVATSGPGDKVSASHHQAMIRAIFEASAQLPDTRFVIKLHPKDQERFYAPDQAGTPPPNLQLVPRSEPLNTLPIYTWLQGCSAVVTSGSGAAIDAMLMDVPVITLDFQGDLSDVDFIARSATLHVKQPTVLVAALREALDGAYDSRPARDFIRWKFDVVDGKASQRAADAILRGAASNVSA